MISHGKRWKYAFRAFFSLIFHGRIADDILAAFVDRTQPAPAAVAPQPPADSADRAVQLLALFQRDGRLVDFLMEDLSGYADAQVGAAVRDVHAACRESLARYITVSPVVDDEEGRTVEIPAGADPARIKLVGNVAGPPPYRGIVRHRGWQATHIDLPPLPAAGRSVVAPAEIEVA